MLPLCDIGEDGLHLNKMLSIAYHNEKYYSTGYHCRDNFHFLSECLAMNKLFNHILIRLKEAPVAPAVSQFVTCQPKCSVLILHYLHKAEIMAGGTRRGY